MTEWTAKTDGKGRFFIAKFQKTYYNYFKFVKNKQKKTYKFNLNLQV